MSGGAGPHHVTMPPWHSHYRWNTGKLSRFGPLLLEVRTMRRHTITLALRNYFILNNFSSFIKVFMSKMAANNINVLWAFLREHRVNKSSFFFDHNKNLFGRMGSGCAEEHIMEIYHLCLVEIFPKVSVPNTKWKMIKSISLLICILQHCIGKPCPTEIIYETGTLSMS